MEAKQKTHIDLHLKAGELQTGHVETLTCKVRFKKMTV